MNILKKSLLALSVAASAAAVSHAQSTVTFDAFFQADYSDAGNLTLGNGVLTGDYFGTASLFHQFQVIGDVDINTPYFWTLDISFDLEYNIDYEGSNYSDSLLFATGPIPLHDLLTGGAPFSISELTFGLFGVSPDVVVAELAAFFSGFPNPGTGTDLYDGFGLDAIFGPAPSELDSLLYYQVSPFPNGQIDFALTEEIDGLEYASIIAALNITLTLVPVPEPSTYGLIGAGALVGLIGFRRFKAHQLAA